MGWVIMKMWQNCGQSAKGGEKSVEEENKLREKIIELGIATEEEVDLVCNINGYSIDTLNDIIFAKTGYRDIEQYLE
jgi:hypothetical protein